MKACNFQRKACRANCGQISALSRLAATHSPTCSPMAGSWACVVGAVLTQPVGAWVDSELWSLVMLLISQVQTDRQMWVEVLLLAAEVTSRGFKDHCPSLLNFSLFPLLGAGH